MKNLILFFIIIFNNIVIHAQTSKGNLITGGSVDFNSSKNNFTYPDNGIPNSVGENKYRSFNLTPSIGYFIVDKLALGVAVGVNSSEQRYKREDINGYDETIYSSSAKSLGIFARKYFLNTKNLGFYAGLNLGAGPSKSSTKSHNYNNQESTSESKGVVVKAALNGGLAYFPTPHIGLQAGITGIGWSMNKGKNTNSTTSEESTYNNNSFNLNLGSLALSIGVYYIFGCKK